MSFSNLYVFPGGNLEPSDYINNNSAEAYGAYKKASIRETREETGISIEREDLISFWAHWKTPQIQEGQPLFSTVFFITSTSQEHSIKNNCKEVVASEWQTPKSFLDRFQNKMIGLAPPQFYILSQLEKIKSQNEFKELFNSNMEVERKAFVFHPKIITHKGKIISILPGDREYEGNNQGTDFHRMILDKKDITKLESISIIDTRFSNKA